MFEGDEDFTFSSPRPKVQQDDGFTYSSKPYNPMADSSIPSYTKGGTKRQAWAQLVQEQGRDMGHGFKETDSSVMGTSRRIREDGAIWNGKSWVDPDTGQDAGATPAKAADPWAQGSDWGGEKSNPDDAVLAKRGFSPHQISRIKASSNYQPGTFVKAEEWLGKDTLLGDMMGTKMGRAVTGAMDVGVGAAQLVEHANPLVAPMLAPAKLKGILMGTQEYDKDFIDAVAKIREQLIQENTQDATKLPIVGDPFRLAGNIAVPLPGSGAAKGGGILKNIAAAALRGAEGGLVQPVADGGYASQKTKDVLFGTGIGAGMGTGGQALKRMLSKKTTIAAPKDVTQLAGDIESSMLNAASRDIATLQAIAKSGGARADEASRLIQEINAAGSDAPYLLQLSAKTKRLTEKASNDEAFGKVASEMKGMGQSPVPNTIAAIDETVAELKKNPYPGLDQAIETLMDFRSNLLPKKVKVSTKLLDQSGKPIEQEITTHPDLSYAALSEARSTLKKKLRAIYKADPTGGEDAKGIDSRQYQRIADALEGDLDNAVRAQKPSAIPLSEAARAQYRDYKQKWGRDTLNRSIVESTAPDEILRKYVGGAAGSDRASNVLGALTNTGVESTKLQMLKHALGTADGNPATFGKELAKVQKATGVFFQGDDLARLEGLKKIMKFSANTGKAVTSGAGAYVGGHFGPGSALAGAILGPKVGIKGVAMPSEDVSRLMAKLMSTPKGQKLLLEANTYNPRSPAWDDFLSRIQDYMARGGAERAARPED